MKHADVIEWFETGSWMPYSIEELEGKAFCHKSLDVFIDKKRLYFLPFCGLHISFTLDSLRIDSKGDLTNGLGNLHLTKRLPPKKPLNGT